MADAIRASLFASTPRSTAMWQAAACGVSWRRIDLDQDSYYATPVLSKDEIERASRFVFQRDRRRYIVGRTALRLALAEVLDRPPERIAFSYGEHGKPYLSDGNGWQFNLSHSGNIGLIAVGRADHVGEVGIDVEEFGPVSDWRLLAAAHMSAEEFRAIDGCPDEDQSRNFLACWTRKEACVKALGAGLTLPTTDFNVGLDGDFTVAIAHGDEVRDLSGASIPAGKDCIAAIAWRHWTAQPPRAMTLAGFPPAGSADPPAIVANFQGRPRA